MPSSRGEEGDFETEPRSRIEKDGNNQGCRSVPSGSRRNDTQGIFGNQIPPCISGGDFEVLITLPRFRKSQRWSSEPNSLRLLLKKKPTPPKYLEPQWVSSESRFGEENSLALVMLAFCCTLYSSSRLRALTDIFAFSYLYDLAMLRRFMRCVYVSWPTVLVRNGW